MAPNPTRQGTVSPREPVQVTAEDPDPLSVQNEPNLNPRDACLTRAAAGSLPSNVTEGPMRVGVAIAELPNMLQGIVFQILQAEPDFEVINIEGAEAENLLEAAERHALQVLIVCSSPEGPTAAQQLVYQCPRMSVLGLAADGRSADLFFLQPRRERLGELTPGTFVDALRSVGVDG